MKFKLSCTCFLVFLLNSISLAEMNQFLPGMYGAGNEDIEAIKKYHPVNAEPSKEIDPFITFEDDREFIDGGDNGPDFISEPLEMSRRIEDKSKRNLKGVTLPGDYSNYPQYLEFKNDQILKEYEYDSKERLTVGIIYDTYQYKNSANTFNRVYRDSPKSDVYGILNIGYDYLMINENFKFLVGGGFGFGYNGGKGVFEGESLEESSSISESTQISLYTVPLDLRLTLEFPLTRYFGLAVTGGPSVVFIQEHRNDKVEGEAERDRRQFGFGYFATGIFKIHLGYIYKDLGFKYLSSEDVSRFTMNVFARNQYYEFPKNESKDISIEGTSVGLGFSYDFI